MTDDEFQVIVMDAELTGTAIHHKSWERGDPR